MPDSSTLSSPDSCLTNFYQLTTIDNLSHGFIYYPYQACVQTRPLPLPIMLSAVRFHEIYISVANRSLFCIFAVAPVHICCQSLEIFRFESNWFAV